MKQLQTTIMLQYVKQMEGSILYLEYINIRIQ